MIIKAILFFALAALTIALPLDEPLENNDKSKVESTEIDKKESLPPPVEEPNPLVINGPVPINPAESSPPEENLTDKPPSEENPDLDTANTFGFGYGGFGGWGYRPFYGGYGGWGYRPYYGGWRGFGGWRRGWGWGGYGGIGYSVGFYPRYYY